MLQHRVVQIQRVGQVSGVVVFTDRDSANAQHAVKAKLVSEWERGEKKPSGPSLKLLSLVKSKGLEAIT